MSNYFLLKNAFLWPIMMLILASGGVYLCLVSAGFNLSCLSTPLEGFFETSITVSYAGFLFMCVVFSISMAVFGWASFYMSSEFNLLFFYLCLLSFVSSMLVLLISDSIFVVFLGWEGLGVTSFALIIFYQNWLSANGGLLTLLTNRLGDAVLMLVLGFWWASSLAPFTLENNFWLLLLLLAIAFTNSAQWPFVNWLPAAIAAPTPVSALVHSSTLVTAGIWLIIRFNQLVWIFNSIWCFFGLLTLCLASIAAFLEIDANNIVALSTLSQLGLMVLALGMGNQLLCLFHVVTHAMAKANLFLVVGNLLHTAFSQQDARRLPSGFTSSTIVSITISIGSLSGLFFMSGFFSNEQIISSNLSTTSSIISILMLISIASITFGYCLKLILSLAILGPLVVNSQAESLWASLPLTFIGTISVVVGWIMSLNIIINPLTLNSIVGFYWCFLIIAPVLFLVLLNPSFLLGFSLNELLLEVIKNWSIAQNFSSNLLESSLFETVYLSGSISSYNIFDLGLRAILISMSILIILLMYYHLI